MTIEIFFMRQFNLSKNLFSNMSINCNGELTPMDAGKRKMRSEVQFLRDAVMLSIANFMLKFTAHIFHTAVALPLMKRQWIMILKVYESGTSLPQL